MPCERSDPVTLFKGSASPMRALDGLHWTTELLLLQLVEQESKQEKMEEGAQESDA